MIATLLPGEWFVGGHVLMLGVISVVCMAIVIKGADFLVESAATVAARLGMPAVIIGATIVSLGTTAPETAVSVLAAWGGKPGLALGNGVGSIIADTGLIFGVGLLLTRLPADKFVLNRQGWVQLGSAVMLAGLCYVLYALQGEDAAVPRLAGVVFLLLLVVYMVQSVRWSRAHPHGEPHLVAETNEQPGQAEHDHEHGDSDRSMPALLGLGLVGLLMVIFAGDALVQSVSEVAVQFSIPQSVIAATVVALGTSLPELVVGVTAIRKGHAELLVGNVIGADILNVLFVIGAAAVAAPLTIVEPEGPPMFLMLHLPTMLVLLLLMRAYIFKAAKTGSFSRWMGVPMVLGYVAYTVTNFVLSF